MALEDKTQTKGKTKSDMKRYDHLGLVEQLNKSDEDQLYIIGAIDAFLDGLSENELREGQKEQSKSRVESGSGLELITGVYSKKYQDNRKRTTFGEFCDIYSVSDSTKNSLKDHLGETIGEIIEKVQSWDYIIKDPKDYFTKEQKEEAKKNLEKYREVMRKIKFVEDKRFAQLKGNAIDRTDQIMSEEKEKAD